MSGYSFCDQCGEVKPVSELLIREGQRWCLHCFPTPLQILEKAEKKAREKKRRAK